MPTVLKEDSQLKNTELLSDRDSFLAIRKGATMKYLLAFVLLVTASCTEHPYTVCRGEEYCTPALTHE